MIYERLPLDDDGNLIESKAPFQSPRSMVIISAPKSGKTDALANENRILIGDADPYGGTAYFDANNSVKLHGGPPVYNKKLGIHLPKPLLETVLELYKANNMEEFNKLYGKWEINKDESLIPKINAVIAAMPFPVFAVDTLTHLTDGLYAAALADVKLMFPTSANIQAKTSIKTVDSYGGQQYVRNTIKHTLAFIEKFAAPFIIYTGHTKETKKVVKKGGDEVDVTDLDFEGQTISTIITSRVSAVGKCYRDDKGVWLSFVKENNNSLSARPRHLSNAKIKISDLHVFEDNKLVELGKTYWSTIYPDVLINN